MHGDAQGVVLQEEIEGHQDLGRVGAGAAHAAVDPVREGREIEPAAGQALGRLIVASAEPQRRQGSERLPGRAGARVAQDEAAGAVKFERKCGMGNPHGV